MGRGDNGLLLNESEEEVGRGGSWKVRKRWVEVESEKNVGRGGRWKVRKRWVEQYERVLNVEDEREASINVYFLRSQYKSHRDQ